MTAIPPIVRAALWSYDADRLDLERDKTLIMRAVLNYGTHDAVHWLRETYPLDDIKTSLRTSTSRSWSPKSLRYWSVMLDTRPEHDLRTDPLT